MSKVHNAVMPVPAALIGRIMSGDMVRVSFYFKSSMDVNGNITSSPDLNDVRSVKVNFRNFKGVSVSVTPTPKAERSNPIFTGTLLGTISELIQNPVTNVWEMSIVGDFDIDG